ncbi:hypothetical protein [Bartonella sp. DGB2]|uniref:hypothetical protein n=1 Tax=Bartonella sp. DGB2 TaxID=3388426 RepID=UPI00398FAA08
MGDSSTGECLVLDGKVSSREQVDWIKLDALQLKLMEDELTDFIKLEKNINVLPSVLPDYSCIGAYHSDLSAAVAELGVITKALLLSAVGRTALALHEYKNQPLGEKRIIFIFRSDALDLRSSFAFNVITGQFEEVADMSSEYFYGAYPFGLDIPLIDFMGMVRGDLQIWDIVGLSVRSWFVGAVFDGIIPFFYSYYGENGSPELLECIIEKHMAQLSERGVEDGNCSYRA